MKSVPLLLLALLLPSSRAADPATLRLGETTAQVRLGWDSNPIGSEGSSATLLGDDASFTTSVSAGLALLSGGTGDARTLKLAYTGDRQNFSNWSSENFTAHRFGFAGQVTAGEWKTTWDASSLFIDGSRATLRATASVNANAVAMWRERRRQWQHRLKAQTQATYERTVVRGSLAVLDYEYATDLNPANVAFADRSDLQAGIDVGWRQSATSLWLAGVRTGRQVQAIVPLPGCEFDYSNRYQRLAFGWEGAPTAKLTVALLAGPDFRHYSGQIDPRVFANRDRTSLWGEGSFSAKPTSSLTLTGRLHRFEWLSSTGKSAYRDTCTELGVTWSANPAWTVRGSAKLHRCDYYPAVRDDWEAFFAAGVTRRVSARTSLTFDLTHHRAWNNLPAFAEREFDRWIFVAGLVWKN